MKKILLVSILIFSAILLFSCATSPHEKPTEDPLNYFFKKDSVVILVTDSGLGGLSVAANVVKRMDSLGVFSSAQVIFFNAQPSKEQGYNSMKTAEQKIAVFNSALEAMATNFKPDILLVACNTLSVLYDYTEFSKSNSIPVIGVVEAGVKLMGDAKQKNENASILLFATRTTVNQDSHREGLAKLGLDPKQVITQSCPSLAGAIERGTQSTETDSLVELYTKNAIANLPEGTDEVYVSLNCTHYPYIKDLFSKKIESEGLSVAEVLDPNPYMADILFPEKYVNRISDPEVTVYVLSQPVLDDDRIASIGPLIKKMSPITAEALENWDFDPQFFEWESIVNAE
jgi:glutamate racemase